MYNNHCYIICPVFMFQPQFVWFPNNCCTCISGVWITSHLQEETKTNIFQTKSTRMQPYKNPILSNPYITWNCCSACPEVQCHGEFQSSIRFISFCKKIYVITTSKHDLYINAQTNSNTIKQYYCIKPNNKDEHRKRKQETGKNQPGCKCMDNKRAHVAWC